MRGVRFDAAALAELVEIHAHISADNPAAVARVVGRIETIAELLVRFPDMGRKLRHRPERMIVVDPYPYVMFYRSAGDEIHIRRIRHAARRRPELQETVREFRV
ncbi:MAG: type II toxin-antitoxin system RelE/ParE family toxin [Rhizomicrobium sp.]